MPGRMGFVMLDNSKEKKGFSLRTGEVTAISLPGLLTQAGTLRAAIEGITLGVVADESLSVYDTNLSNSAPASVLAQIEVAWLVQFEDNLPFFDDPVNAIPNEGFGRLFTVTIPTADLVTCLASGSDEVVLTQPQIATFITAFQAVARSPYGGTVTVKKITHVGRNN